MPDPVSKNVQPHFPPLEVQLAVLNERCEAILHSIDELKESYKQHLLRCHIDMNGLRKSNAVNTTFRKIAIGFATVFSGVFVTIVVIGFKEWVKRPS